MLVELLSVPIDSPLNQCEDNDIYNRCGREYMQGEDTRVIAGFTDFFLLEEILYDDILGVCKCEFPIDYDGWIRLCEEDLDVIVDQMTPELGLDPTVDILLEACRQAKQHLADGRSVYAYIEVTDPDGEHDGDHNAALALLRGKVVMCVLDPDQYGYYNDPEYVFLPQVLKKSLLQARPGEVVRPGQARFIYDENGGEPLFYIQRIHLTNKRILSKDPEQYPRKMRRSSAGV